MSDWITWQAPYTGWAITLLVAVLGIAIAVRGLRRRSPKTDTGLFARCGYDLRGSPSDRCSECGGEVGETAPRLPRRWRWLFIGGFIAIALPVAVVAKRVNEYGLKYYGYYGPLYWVLPDETVEELAHGSYVVRLSRDRYPDSSNERTLKIWQNGSRVYERHGWYFTLGLCDADTPLGPVADLDGDGSDELIVQQSDGGNAGFYQTIICSLSEDPAKRKILLLPGNLVIDGGKSDGTGGRLLNARVPFYFQGYGRSVWKGVVLRYDAGHVTFVADAMRRALPYSSAELDEKSRKIRLNYQKKQQPSAFDDFEIADTMLELVFTGHSAEAYKFLDQAWPSDEPAKDRFIERFRRRLSDSPAREVLMTLGHTPLDPPSQREAMERYGH
ncbi:MAG: hypothetical protein QM754_14285 [Tepidisphaeraceae bacterium]